MDEHALDCVKRAGAIAGEARELGVSMVGPGRSLAALANEVEAYIMSKGAKPAFPVNISINEVAAHFSPNNDDRTTFQPGDVVKVDVGAHVDGYIGDTAATVEVGSRNWDGLIESSHRALMMAVEMIGDGTPVSAIGGTIKRSIIGSGYRPVANLHGHEMKRFNLHAGLSIPNVDDDTLAWIRNDMVIAVEPFATNGNGVVNNGKPGNIYRVIRDRPIKDEKAAKMLDLVSEYFGPLPFCERWCDSFSDDAAHQLKLLLRHGVISSYPQLKEKNGAVVSQAEHTLLVRNGKCEITTRR